MYLGHRGAFRFQMCTFCIIRWPDCNWGRTLKKWWKVRGEMEIIAAVDILFVAEKTLCYRMKARWFGSWVQSVSVFPGVLELRSVRPGETVIKGVSSALYLCVDSGGCLRGQVRRKNYSTLKLFSWSLISAVSHYMRQTFVFLYLFVMHYLSNQALLSAACRTGVCKGFHPGNQMAHLGGYSLKRRLLRHIDTCTGLFPQNSAVTLETECYIVIIGTAIGKWFPHLLSDHNARSEINVVRQRALGPSQVSICLGKCSLLSWYPGTLAH